MKPIDLHDVIHEGLALVPEEGATFTVTLPYSETPKSLSGSRSAA